MIANKTRFLAKLGAAAAVAAGLAFTGQAAASADPGPSLSVTPSTGLADGAVVTVSVTGAGANEAYGIAQCADVSGVMACNAATATGFTSDAGGAATFPLTVNAVFEGSTPDGSPAGTVDCTTVACYVGGGNETLGLGTVPISFAAEPVALAPKLSVTPSSGLADGASVTVNVTGAAANDNYGIAECADVSGVMACNAATATGFTSDASGAATFPLTVNKVFQGSTAEGNPVGTVNCAVDNCYVGGGNSSLGLGTVHISFN
jgi:ferredoxin